MTARSSQPSAVGTRHHVVVIPCRWGASRFPGKPIADLAGKPLLWHVYQRCLQATPLAHALVATDDKRIAAVCDEHGIPWMMTGTHPTGTDRVAECAEHLDADAYLNVQETSRSSTAPQSTPSPKHWPPFRSTPSPSTPAPASPTLPLSSTTTSSRS
jgi:hypothetical protein